MIIMLFKVSLTSKSREGRKSTINLQTNWEGRDLLSNEYTHFVITTVCNGCCLPQTWIPFTQGWFVRSLVEIDPVVLGKEIFLILSLYFRYFLIISLGKGRGPSFEQTWIPFTQGCFVPSLVEIGSMVLEKKMKIWNVYDNANNDDDDNDDKRLTTDKFWSEKLCLLIGRHFSFMSRLRMVYLWWDFIILIPMKNSKMLANARHLHPFNQAEGLCRAAPAVTQDLGFPGFRGLEGSSGSPREYTVNVLYLAMFSFLRLLRLILLLKITHRAKGTMLDLSYINPF